MIIMKKENKKTKGIIMKKTFFKKLFTASIAAITALSVFRGVPTFADTVVNTPTADTDIRVSIRKTLNIAEGVTTPEAAFTFKFTAKQVDADGVQGAKTSPVSDVTEIPNRVVTYGASDELQSNATSIKKETSNIFDGISYSHAGEYVYDVKELDNTNGSIWNPITKNGKVIDYMAFDSKNYEMHVFVKNKKNGNGTYISTVYFKEISTGGTTGAKKDSEKSKQADFTFDLFTNTYRKDGGKIDPKDPNPNKPTDENVDPDAKSLIVKKLVAGDFGSKTKDFTFTLTFTKGSTDETGTFTGKVGNNTYTFTSGVAQTITLRHDQSLVFDNIPAGTRYTLKENGESGYTASADYKENGEAKTKADGVQSADFLIQNILVGEKTNDNTITNKFQDVTPTGLLIDNLPFILMIGLGLAGFVVLSKKRREA